MANPAVFAFTDAQQTERALIWLTCYASTDGKAHLAWAPTYQAIRYVENKGRKHSDQKIDLCLPKAQYFERLMKLIPLGLADGSITSSFADPYELMCFLMRSIGIDESTIQNQLQQYVSPSMASQYLLNRPIKTAAESFKATVLQIAKTQGVAAARAYLNQVKTAGAITSPPVSVATTTTSSFTVGTRTLPTSLRGIRRF